MGNPPETEEDIISNDDNTNKNINQDNEEHFENKYSERGFLDTAEKIINHDIPVSDELGSGKQVYKCEECEASYKVKSSLRQHTRSKHEGICYSCKYCGYKATSQGARKKHQESIHEGVKYPCNQCDYQATWQTDLKRHIKSVHDGVKYSCDKCNYQTGWKHDIKKHKSKKH